MQSDTNTRNNIVLLTISWAHNIGKMALRENYSKSSTPSSSKNSHVVTTWSHEWLIEDFFRREEAVGSAIQTKFAVAVLDNKNTKFETVWRVKL